MNAAEWLRERAATYRAAAEEPTDINHWRKVYTEAAISLGEVADHIDDGKVTVAYANDFCGILAAELRDAARIEREQATT